MSKNAVKQYTCLLVSPWKALSKTWKIDADAYERIFRVMKRLPSAVVCVCLNHGRIGNQSIGQNLDFVPDRVSLFQCLINGHPWSSMGFMKTIERHPNGGKAEGPQTSTLWLLLSAICRRTKPLTNPFTHPVILDWLQFSQAFAEL